MSALGSLVVKLALEYAEYTQGLNKADQEALKFAKNAQKHFDAAQAKAGEFFTGMATKAAGVVTAFLAVDAVIGKLNQSIDSLARLDDMAQKYGTAVEELSKLQKVATAFGQDFGAVDGAIAKLAKGMASADDETSKTNKALAALGLSAKDAAGKLRDPSELMVQVAKRLQDYEDGAAKAALVTDLFGKSGAELMPFLNDLAENIDKFSGVSTEAAARAAAFQDKMGLMRVKADELYTSLALSLLPSVTDFVDSLNDVIGASDNVAGNTKLTDWTDSLALGLARVIDVAMVMPTLFSAVASSINAAGASSKVFMNSTPAVMLGKLVSGGSPIQDVKAAYAEAEKAAAEAKQKLDDLWNKPANQMEQAVLNRLAERNSPGNIIAGAVAAANAAAGDSTDKKKGLDYPGGNNSQSGKEKLTEYQKLTRSINEKIAAQDLEYSATQKVTEGEKLAAKLKVDLREGTLKLTAAEQATVEALLAQLTQRERLNDAKQEAEKAETAAAAARQKEIAAIFESVEKIQLEVDTYGMLPSQVTAATIAKLEQRKASLLLSGEALPAEIAQVEALIIANQKLAGAQAKKEGKDYAKQAADEAADAWKKTADDIQDWLGDALQRGFEDGKGFLKSFVTAIKSAFARLIINPIVAPIAAAGASYLNPTAAQAGGNNGTALQAASLLQTGQSAWGAMTGGATSTMGGWVAGAGNYFGSASMAEFGAGMQGATLAPGLAGPTTAGSTGAMGAGTTTATVAGIAAGVAGGVYGGRAISGGYSAWGGSGNSAVNTGTAIGAAVGSIVPVIGTAIGALVGGLIGGVVNRAFGHRPEQLAATGITGTFTDTGFEDGRTYSNYVSKGGWFTSDKTRDVSLSLDSQIAAQLSRGYDTVKASTVELAEALKLPTDTISGYAKAVNIALSKETDPVKAAAENIQLLTKQFSEISDELASRLIPNIGEFAQIGETTTQTLTRLAQMFSAIDSVLLTIGSTSEKAFGAVGLASIDARERLVRLAGSIDALSNGAVYFAQNFMTEAERMAPIVADVKSQMAGLGLAQIQTKEQFKQYVTGLVNGGGLALESGAKLYTQLMQLAPAFNQAATYAEQLANANVDSAYSSLSKLLQESIDGARELSEAAREAVRSLLSSAGLGLSRDGALAQINDAIAKAKSGGGLTSADSLAEALNVLSNSSTSTYATLLDYQRGQLQTANSLEELAGLADEQLSADEQMLKNAEEQINVLRGIDTSIQTIPAALAAFQAAMSAAMAATAPASPGTSFDIGTLAPDPVAPAPTPSAEWTAVNGFYNKYLGRDMEEPTWLNVHLPNLQRGMSMSEMEWWIANSDEAKRRQGIPGYASGGYHEGGLRIVGENGPELEFTGPSRIVSNPDSRKLFDTSGLQEELRALRAEVRQLRQENQAAQVAIATNTNTAAKVLRKFDDDGLPAERIVTA